MESATLFEWAVGAIFVGVNAYRRYNTPVTNRESTTFQNFGIYFLFYLLTTLTLYVFFGAVIDSSPETLGTLFGLLSGVPDATLPGSLSNLSAPMISALFLTTLLPSLPFLSRYDQMLLNTFWDRGHIPNHAVKMAASMRRAAFNFSPRQIKQIRDRCQTLQIDYEALSLNDGLNLDFRWTRINVLLDSINEWKVDDHGRMRRYMKNHSDELNQLFKLLDEINDEFIDLKNEKLEAHVQTKIQKYLERAIRNLMRLATVFAAKATCYTELSESSRRSRTTQLGFEGGSSGQDGLSGRQAVKALLAILFTFLSLSILQELGKDAEYRRFGAVIFVTFLMFFTYGSTLIIALDLKSRVSMGYNELTRERSWSAYLTVGIITAMSWLLVTISYRYITNMLSGISAAGAENVVKITDGVTQCLKGVSKVIDDPGRCMSNYEQVISSIEWSYPYALQSLALAISVSWILDHHQSRGMSGAMTLQQRLLDVGISVAALGLASFIAFCWMEGLFWFDGFATRDAQYIGRASMGWFVLKGMAVAAIIGWLVPTWFDLNRSKAPDQIAGRLITMNRRGLAEDIRNLNPDELIKAVAAVSASVAASDGDVSRHEKDVYQIICGHLSGLPNYDVDIDSADREFEIYREQLDEGQPDLEDRLAGIRELPLLASLMPFIASSVAFADGVYLEREDKMVEEIKSILQLSAAQVVGSATPSGGDSPD